jgi:2-keto-3-deoxy-L-fuconate dehydrogenase
VDDDPDLGGDGDLDRPGKCLVSASEGRLVGRRILVTSARTYMGPAIASLFRAEGADVIADDDPLTEPGAPAALVDRCGHLDAVVANLDLPAYGAGVVDIDDGEWLAGFDAMVHPLMRLARAVSPQMIERGAGAIVAVTSSSPLRRMSPHAIAYVAARAAQNAFVRSAGHELAKHGVRFNAIAQNFVANDTYYPPEVLANPKFQERLQREVPARRIGRPEETAELALYLVSESSSFMYGQIVSHDGGWS